jgi:hypothetical protein
VVLESQRTFVGAASSEKPPSESSLVLVQAAVAPSGEAVQKAEGSTHFESAWFTAC